MWDDKKLRKLFRSFGLINTTSASINLPEILSKNEDIEFAQRCKVEKENWLMICTTNRLIMITEKLFSMNFKEFSFSKISSVESYGGIKFNAGLKIEYSGGEMECKMSGVYASRMRECILHHLHSENNGVNVVVNNNSPSQTNSPYDEVKKLKDLLDMGVITQEEFEIKKKELLGL